MILRFCDSSDGENLFLCMDKLQWQSELFLILRNVSAYVQDSCLNCGEIWPALFDPRGHLFQDETSHTLQSTEDPNQ